MRLLRGIVWVGVVLGGCQNGPKLAAEGTGDVSNPPAPRQSADATLRAQCGDGSAVPGASSVIRAPYLQQLASDGADIVALVSGSAEVDVDVDLPDRTPVLTASSTPENHQTIANTASTRPLEPGRTYCYSLRGLTTRAGFRTAPAAGTHSPVRMVAFGDSGSGDGFQEAVFAQIMNVPFDFVLHLGDLAYEQGTADELERTFFQVYAPMLRSFPVFPVIGNHDDATDDGQAYLDAFVLPENGPQQERERVYSFDWGDVHVAALDTERINASQAAWLDADLAATQRPWKIVMGHRPPFSSGEHGPNVAFQEAFGPTLERHHVDLVLSGHEHDYQRFLPHNGVTYIVSGGGGRDTRPVDDSDDAMSAYAEDVLHFLVIEIEGSRLLVHAIDGLGREFDSTKIEHT